jgi:CheY-like chemotaxis protein
MKVLIVDDVELNYQLLLAAVRDLSDEGVLIANRATESIEIAIREQPDVIFMDIGLPDMDGLEATELLKGNPNVNHIPVVIVSAHAQATYIERSRQLGCLQYMVKPLSVREVRNLVGELKSQKRAALGSRTSDLSLSS